LRKQPKKKSLKNLLKRRHNNGRIEWLSDTKNI
jgi:hypothetical protein